MTAEKALREIYSQLLLLAKELGVDLQQETQSTVLVFDYGGVLANADYAPLLQFFQTTFGLNNSELKALLAHIKMRRLQGKSEEVALAEWAEREGHELDEDFSSLFEAAKGACIQKVDGMDALVKRLKERGYRVALFSNVRKDQADVIRRWGCYEAFPDVILSHEIGAEKPSQEAFDALFQRLRCAKEHCILIDDKEENVLAAQAYGMKAIRFEHLEQLEGALQDLGVSVEREPLEQGT